MIKIIYCESKNVLKMGIGAIGLVGIIKEGWLKNNLFVWLIFLIFTWLIIFLSKAENDNKNSNSNKMDNVQLTPITAVLILGGIVGAFAMADILKAKRRPSNY